ncbi:hypothetical protein Pmani_018101 [Petrolisthes manimaculis]|uniref:Uncharacterized protein n=1 Tax=Petrolisthes manimaculis TaxID=1843537 RepID=A0AAE1PNK3_9EUCA|nr:hypothetical protein Pmani_018101 [Petrolisthes manimaculis]
MTPQGETLPSNTGPANIWNITNFLPAKLPTEDDASVQRHIQLLKEQQKILPWNRNASIIADSMLSTLSDRCSLIIAEFSSVLDLDSEKKFCEGLNTYSSAITRLPPLKEEHESIQKLRIEAASSTKTK